MRRNLIDNPKIRVRDFFWRIFRRNTRCGDIFALAAAVPGEFAPVPEAEEAARPKQGEGSLIIRNASGRNDFFSRPGQFF